MIRMYLWFDADESVDPKMFSYVINGMASNPLIDFMIFTNREEKFFHTAKNISVIQYDRNDIIDKINNLFSLSISHGISSKELGRDFICGFKPYIPIIFDEFHDSHFKYYGWLDHEVIFSDGFDVVTLNYLYKNNDIFSLGCCRDSGHFQVMSNDINFIKYLYVNRFLYLGWYRVFDPNPWRVRYFDDISIHPADGLIGFVGLRDLYRKNKISQDIRSVNHIVVIGSDYTSKTIMPRFTFSINYSNGKFDKNSIVVLDDSHEAKSYKDELINANIIWSLDQFFKNEDFDFSMEMQNFTFKSNAIL